jgi:hypothetical protein
MKVFTFMAEDHARKGVVELIFERENRIQVAGRPLRDRRPAMIVYLQIAENTSSFARGHKN